MQGILGRWAELSPLLDELLTLGADVRKALRRDGQEARARGAFTQARAHFVAILGADSPDAAEAGRQLDGGGGGLLSGPSTNSSPGVKRLRRPPEDTGQNHPVP